MTSALSSSPSSSPTSFDPCAPLSASTLAIEASAGTGKTYALAGLATRLLAEGAVTADGLLMVTFTRAATGELRSRVRDRLVETAAHLRRAMTAPVPTDDVLLAMLASSTAAGGSLADRADRLDRAISEFDFATITTIHGFANQVLTSLGIASGLDADVRFVDDTSDRVVEVCSDLLSMAAVDPTSRDHLPTWDTFLQRTRVALQSPDTIVVPRDGQSEVGAKDRLLAELVRRAVDLMGARRVQAGTQSFDGLLNRLRDAFDGTPGASGIVESVRRGYQVALIDEFQDTDPAQWMIFRTLFGEGPRPPGSAFVLVGDPKQAIYSFRGADVQTYVRATGSAERRSLETNWRSNGAMVTALDTLFSGTSFGSEIDFQSVRVAEANRERRLGWADGSDGPVLQIRCASGPDFRAKTEVKADDARHEIFADLAAHTVQLLEHGTLPPDDPDHSSPRAVRPNDIAVLVRSNKDAQSIQSVLADHGVPAVLARGSSVLDSSAAVQLRWLLDAMVRPSDPRRARTFALSWFGGRDMAWVGGATDADLVSLQERLHRWNVVVTTTGLVDLLRKVWNETAVIESLLRRPGGERDVTDLEHLAELLRMSLGDGPVSAAGLLAALDGESIAREGAPETDQDTDIASRRVESDAQAVQIMTVWVSKGLEFPIVLCPTMWSINNGDRLFHADGEASRSFDVSGAKSAWPDKAGLELRNAMIASERQAEELRLLYVALTRARHHTAVWWVRYRDGHRSALARLLFGRTPEGEVDPEFFQLDPESFLPMGKPHQPPHDQICARLQPLVDRSGGAISVAEHGHAPPEPRTWVDPERAGEPNPLVAARFDRTLYRRRSRWSFTAITARDDKPDHGWTHAVNDEGADDEQRPPDVGIDAEAPYGGGGEPSVEVPESSLAWLPAGAAFGTLAHEVLEDVDFTHDDLAAHVGDVVSEQMSWRGLDLRPVVPADDSVVAAGGSADADADAAGEAEGARLLATGLVEVIRTPLGPLFDGRCLADVGPSDCLDEMSFELTLNSGGGAASTVRDIGRLLVQRLPDDDPFRTWAADLADGIIKVALDGHLTGSIDAVIRLAGHPDGPTEPRFVVVDYKSNRLHEHGRAPMPGDYGAATMRASMFEHEYPLQALLYQVAVHRYLRWRLDDYRPDTHLGGIAYLYLRGMSGPAVRTVDGHPDGVCTWQVPGDVVEALSDLLDGRTSRSGR